MTNPKKRKSVVNVGVDVGKWMLDVCIYSQHEISVRSSQYLDFD